MFYILERMKWTLWSHSDIRSCGFCIERN